MTLDDIDIIYIYDEWGYYKALSKVPNIPVETEHPHMLIGDNNRSICFVSADCLPRYSVEGDVFVRPVFFTKIPDFNRVPGTQVIIDGINRALIACMFLFLAWRCWVYGLYMMRKGIGTMTLQLPLFWVMWLMAFSFLVVVLVKIQHLMHPGKEMMKA